MWQALLKGRLFGHPVHPMLVHFPGALFPAAFLFDVAGILFNETELFSASFYVILLGLAGGLLAGLFGMVDYIKLGARIEEFRTASWHGGIQVIVLIIFGVIFGLRLQAYPDLDIPSTVQLFVMAITLAIMFFGNYLGGELVFGHRVGVNNDE